MYLFYRSYEEYWASHCTSNDEPVNSASGGPVYIRDANLLTTLPVEVLARNGTSTLADTAQTVKLHTLSFKFLDILMVWYDCYWSVDIIQHSIALNSVALRVLSDADMHYWVRREVSANKIGSYNQIPLPRIVFDSKWIGGIKRIVSSITTV